MPKYGLSAVAIGKTCRKLQVPLPGRGYWAKKAHGHSVVRKALPELLEVPRIIRYQKPTVASTIPSPPAQPEFPVEPEDRTDIDRINQMLAAGEFVFKKPRKALAPSANRRGPRYSSTQFCLQTNPSGLPWNESCLDIRVSRSRLSRALEIMAAIISILEDHGVRVRVVSGDQSYGRRSNETAATIFGERIQFGITERTKREREQPGQKDPRTLPHRYR